MSERPFCFVVVVWGEKFRNYLLDYCLTSLLAPGNIPALQGSRPVKYLFATTAEDWRLMRETAIFRVFERHAEPVFVELPPHPPERPYWMQAILGHRLCCDAIHAEGAYRIFTAPDTIYADGSIAHLNTLARQGAEAVLRLTVPSTEEASFFDVLRRQGVLPDQGPLRESGAPLIISKRQLVSAALRSMHRMAAVNEWDQPFFCGYAATPFWRVPGEEGIVCCGLNWDVFLIDYGAVTHHDSAILDERGFDGDYNMRTIGMLNKIYAIRDTDEVAVFSWNDLPYPSSLKPPLGGVLGKGAAFRKTYYGPSFNKLHRQLFFLPTRIHAGSLNEKWRSVEETALRTLSTWLDAPPPLAPLGSAMPAASAFYREIDARIASIARPWWRNNALIWGVCRSLVLPSMGFANGFWRMARTLPTRVAARLRREASALIAFQARRRVPKP